MEKTKHARQGSRVGIFLALLLFGTSAFLSFLHPALAAVNQSNVTITNPVPTVRVVFDEPIIIQQAIFYSTNQSRDYEADAVAVNSSIVTVTPVNALPNGKNTLYLNVTDAVGNLMQYATVFTVQAPLPTLTLLMPRLGMSNQSVFDIKVKTMLANAPLSTQCKYGLSNPAFNFDAPGLNLFDSDSTDHAEHTKIGFTGVTPNLPLGVPAPLYVICKDAVGRIIQQRFDLYVDTIPPSIQTIGLDPTIITERDDGGFLKTLLTVISANNDAVICRYGLDNSDYGTMLPFPNYNILDFSSYKAQSNATVKEFDAAQTQKDYNLFVQCEDRAGLLSDLAVRLVKVDLSQALVITVTSPQPYQSNSLVELRLNTNKNANCLYGVDGANPTQQMSPTSSQAPAKTHIAALGTMATGQHTIKVLCSSGASGQFQTGEKTITFVIDTTAPASPTITGPSLTCTGDGFTFDPPLTLTSSDADSGIAYYLYSLNGPQGLLLNFTQSTSGSISEIRQSSNGNPINLTPKAQYTLTAKAVNNVGLESTTTNAALQYDPTRSICLEKTPPSVTIRKANTLTGVNVTLSCTDNVGCDNSSYYYGTASDRSNCKATQHLADPFSVELYSTQYFCYNVSDVNKNAVSGTELIRVTVVLPPSCTDSKKDGNETDIDCGTDCPPCQAGKICRNNTDCINGFCTNGRCTEPSCSDAVKNQDESDVDCGGKCPACTDGKICIFNTDCQGGYCTNKQCGTPSCIDGIANGKETDVDCGGTCPKCIEGQRCFSNSDCESGSCKLGFCEPERPLPPINQTPTPTPTGQKDTDGDGIPDDVEIRNGLNPNDPKDAGLDMDNDGLTNLQEYQHKTSMSDKDTDGDGFTDGEEIEAGSDPLDPKSMPQQKPSGLMEHIKKWLLLYLGLLLLVFGLGYLAYNRYYKRPLDERMKARVSMPLFPSEASLQRPPAQPNPEAEKREATARQQTAALQEKLRKERMVKQAEREKVFAAFGDEHPHMKEPEQKKTEEQKPLFQEPVQAVKQWLGFGKPPVPVRKEEDTFKELSSLFRKEEPKREDVFGELRKISRKTGVKKKTVARSSKRQGKVRKRK